MKQKLLILFVFLLTGISLKVQAYDFSAVCPSGQTLYYNITSSNTVELTYHTKPTGAIVIPDSVIHSAITYSVTSIGDVAFYECTGLTSINIPSSVTSIGDVAFFGCTSLTAILIPNSVNSIGSQAFYNTPYYNNKPDGVVYINNVLYRYKGTMPVNTIINIPEGIISISDHAFEYCSGLTSITIPNSVRSIGDNAFEHCTGITAITIPNSVTSIGHWAFSDCSGLISVNIPNSVTSIDGAFAGCSSLTSITIPNSVTSIDLAFVHCSGLTSIIIPNSVSSINNAFAYCSGLNSVTIPNSVDSIGSGTFYHCSGLNSVIIPNSVTSIGMMAFSGCSNLTSILIPNSVTSIGDCAFENCTGLTAITIPNSVALIGDYAFKNCTSLDTVYFDAANCTSTGSNSYYVFQGCNNLSVLFIGDLVTKIPPYAFYGCRGLNSVTIPNSVTSIGNYAFSDCISLDSIICEAINPPEIGNFTFENVDKTIPIYVPCSSLSAYQGAEFWSYFTNYICFMSLDNGIETKVLTKIYPNPTNGKAKLIVEGLNSEADVLVYDMIGRVIQKYKINKGKYELDIDLIGYSKGIYTIRIVNDIINNTTKLIVQ